MHRQVLTSADSDAHDHPRARYGVTSETVVSEVAATRRQELAQSPRPNLSMGSRRSHADGLLALMAIIGYARVSLAEQNPDLQVDALRVAGAGRASLNHTTGRQ